MNRAEKRRFKRTGSVEGLEATPKEIDKLTMILKAMCISLHDDYGFGAKRCARVTGKVIDMFDAVRTGHLSGYDINFMFNEIKGLHIESK